MLNPTRLRAGVVSATQWLEAHATHLTPDALVFAEIGFRAARLPVPTRLRRPHAGSVGRALIPVSPAFRTVAANVARLYFAYSGTAPCAKARSDPTSSIRATRRDRMERVDRDLINRVLAEAVTGDVSSESRRWMRRSAGTGFTLTHQFLASLLHHWSRRRGARADCARRLGPRVFREAISRRGYGDLLAQQTAFLALSGWPMAGLEPLLRRLLRAQDAGDGGWHYFERTLSEPGETFLRVSEGRSPLLGWPIRCSEADFGTLVAVIHDAHRGHATALALCALGVVTGRTSRGSTP